MDRQQYKEVGLIVGMTIFSAILFGLISTLSLAITSPVVIALITLVSIIWVACMAIALALVAHLGMTTLMVVLISGLLLVISRLHTGAIGAAFLVTILLLVAHARIALEAKNRIKYRTIQLFYAGTKIIILALIISTAGLSIAGLEEEIKTVGVEIPSEAILMILSPIESVVSGTTEKTSSTAIIDELIDNQVIKKLEGLPPGTELPPEQVKQVRQQVSSQLGAELSTQDSVAVATTKIINDQIEKFTKASPVLAALVIIIIIVSILRLLIPALVWPILGVIAGLIYIAKASGFVYLINKDETVERLQL